MALFKRNKQSDKGQALKKGTRIGLEIGPEGVAVAIVEWQKDQTIKLLDCEYIAESDPLKQRALLLNWSSKYSKRSLPCVVTLHPADYQLLLVERPKVSDKELSNAIRWRLQDLLNYSVEQAIYDVFQLPDDAYRGRIKMAYVAVSPVVAVRKIVSMANKNGMNPEMVSIREMSYRNLILNRENSSQDIICVWLDEFSGSITLISHGQIYFSRRLEKDSERWDKKLLQREIELSIDYASNQLGRPKVSRVEMVMPDSTDAQLVNELNLDLEIEILPFTLSDHYTLAEESISKRIGAHTLAAIGAASYPVAEEVKK